jgi:hypothetical protein
MYIAQHSSGDNPSPAVLGAFGSSTKCSSSRSLKSLPVSSSRMWKTLWNFVASSQSKTPKSVKTIVIIRGSDA